MDFRIADTFTDSLGRLTGDEQKLAKTTAFDLQLDPVNPGMALHRLEHAKDRNFWSVRVGRDLRMIVHRMAGSLLLCYVDHHDKAYRWAERRRLEIHPKTGAAQFVEVRDRVEHERVSRSAQASWEENFLDLEPAGPSNPLVADVAPQARTPAGQALFATRSDDELLGYGVPLSWLDEVRRVDDVGVLDLASHLPAEAAEALLELAVGRTPTAPTRAAPDASPFDHPDAQRRFRVMTDVAELQRALDAPWDKWAVFLHPSQRQLIERRFNGPAKVAGSAGTGKTVVALHRAVHLARMHAEHRVLLATFSETLARALAARLRRLSGHEPRLAERLEVASMEQVGRRLFEAAHGRVAIATDETIRTMLADTLAATPEVGLRSAFLLGEWDDVVDAWQLTDWSAYRDAKRLGRKTRLTEAQRKIAWSVFDALRVRLRLEGLRTWAEVYTSAADAVRSRSDPPWDHVVVDEAQDLSPAQMKLLAAIGGRRPDGLFFAGDLGQRIFQVPFSWTSVGVDVRGRARILRINYRTSHQIRRHADRLLAPEIADVDGDVEDRRGTVSVFDGPAPEVLGFDDRAEEIDAVSAWLCERLAEGVAPHEIGLFVRSDVQLDVARAAVAGAGLTDRALDASVETVVGSVSIATMHVAKGLEFRVVVVMACDDEVVPLQSRIDAIVDDGDLEEVYETERHLLYVACTRARDRLLITCVEPRSEFLDDLREAGLDASRIATG